jgi:hypothetical protein
MDTDGHDIDIANMVGLYNSVSRARSVRLVLVFDANTIETARGKVIRGKKKKKKRGGKRNRRRRKKKQGRWRKKGDFKKKKKQRDCG